MICDVWFKLPNFIQKLTEKSSVKFNELLGNFNKEPNADWIDSEDQNQGKTVKLDQERFNGSAFYLQLYRNTEHWKTYLYLRNISPEYQANVGFVVKNNRRWATIFHEYQNFINKKGFYDFDSLKDLILFIGDSKDKSILLFNKKNFIWKK